MSESFSKYYKRFAWGFSKELWSTWRTEAWPSVLIALAIYAITRHQDLNAWNTFLYTAEASGLYLGGWAVYHLVRTPWRMSLVSPAISLPGLKESALALSTEILDFVHARKLNAPKLSPRKFDVGGDDAQSWYDDFQKPYVEMQALSAYEQETREIYEYKYARRVAFIQLALSERAISNEEFSDGVDGINKNSDSTSPPKLSFPDSEYIKMIGRGLGTMSDAVPNEENRNTKRLASK